SRPIARTLTGGEVFLAILISCFGNAASSVERGYWAIGPLRNRSLEWLGESFDFPLQAARKAPPNATIVINNLQGNVRVVGADAPEVKVTGQKSIRALDRAGAEQADRNTPLEITEQAGTLYVRTNQDRLSGERRISADLVVTVPQGASLNLEGRYGDFEVKDVLGSVDVTSNNAGVRLANIGGNVRVNLGRSDVVYARGVKGNLFISRRGRDIDVQDVQGTVTVDGAFSGSIRFQNVAKPVRYTSTQTDLAVEKVPGRIEMELGRLYASDIVGPFRLTTNNKDIRIEDFTRDLEITARRGDVALRSSKAPLGNVQVECSGGNIELELPANARFQLQAATSNGRAENEFGPGIHVEQRKNAAEMKGGSGGAQVRLSTKRGNITLKKLEAGEKI
ncbi:MAG TPA: DUF4097 family beta strand repeat-containing protein, partial [Methylomirabilota bacterium]|nr:DUF4097 family beta strand repeat-containing protein [Methylomirabilota bacterium]